MRCRGEMSQTVAVEVSVVCDAWLAACPDAPALAEAAVRAALAGAACRGDGASVVVDVTLGDDAGQRRLNRIWRSKDMPTNVLAFPLADAVAPAGMPVLLGDVVLAFETVAREAAEQDKKLADHLVHLVVHGVLHLLGFDHQSEPEAALMEAREAEILAPLGVPDPYRDTM